jgi:putative membrane protein
MAREGSALRLSAGVAGLAVAATAAACLRDPLASMASYTAALMALNQLAPPLLLAALPRPHGAAAVAAAVLFDPIAALAAFGALSAGVSLPGLLNPTLAGALYAAPLGALELLTGLMIWAQVMPATRRLRADWRVALLVWIGTLPMTVVAAVWMMAPAVIYTPYLDVICRWDVPPLVDQKWAGFVMLLAGMPLQLAAAWVLLGLGGSTTARRPGDTSQCAA